MTSVGTVVSYPSPPFTNPPIQSNYYQPSQFLISGITLGPTTVVTTTVNHNYVIGQQVRLLIPSSFGSYQLNESQAYVILSPNTNQPLISETAADGTASYSTNLLSTIQATWANAFLIPGSVSFIFNLGGGNQTNYVDDGNGNIIYVSGTYTLSSGTINYASGIISLGFLVNPPNATTANASFVYDVGQYPNIVFLNLNSSVNVNPFKTGSSSNKAQILAIGDINFGFNNNSGNLNTGTYIPGSFINISPN